MDRFDFAVVVGIEWPGVSETMLSCSSSRFLWEKGAIYQ